MPPTANRLTRRGRKNACAVADFRLSPGHFARRGESAAQESQRRHVETRVGKARLVLLRGDITQQDTEAIVNLDLRPPVPDEIRKRVEGEMAANGPQAMHAELDPDLDARVRNELKAASLAIEARDAGALTQISNEL